MKITLCCFMLLLFLTACVLNTSTMPVNVESWKVVKPSEQNRIIQRAYEAKSEWVFKPELYVFNLFDLSGVKRVSCEYGADNTENPESVELTIVRDGFLDDSIRGDIHYLKLKKSSEGIWKVVLMKKAISCWRDRQNKEPVYSLGPCL